MYMFGGLDSSGAATNALFVSDTAAVGWQLLEAHGQLPAPRYGHDSFAWGNQIWVYGGQGQQGHLQDMYRYNTLTRKWTLVEQKVQRLRALRLLWAKPGGLWYGEAGRERGSECTWEAQADAAHV
jgi:N-acetylneuraminic acid mutarotase